jgi:hypothetical protein
MAGLLLLIVLSGLAIFSGAVRLRRQAARRTHRNDTEGARLVTYVKYLSAPGKKDQGSASGGEGPP